jgi:hypothetical protein
MQVIMQCRPFDVERHSAYGLDLISSTAFLNIPQSGALSADRFLSDLPVIATINLLHLKRRLEKAHLRTP